jgi:hypothetical protein
MFELDLSKMAVEDVADLEIGEGITLKVYIPLYSLGMTNSYINICGDYLEAIWIGERLAMEAETACIVYDYPQNTPITRLCLTLTQPGPGIKSALYECMLLYNGIDDSNYELFQDTYDIAREKILAFEDTINNFPTRFPELVDDYFANLVNGMYSEMQSEAPEQYQDEITKYPERCVGYWKSSLSSKLGIPCYVSRDGWLLPNAVNLDRFFEIAGQNYSAEKLIPAKVFTVNNASYVLADGMVAFFPMGHYFKSKICSSFAQLEDEDYWPPHTFDCLDASFSHSPLLAHVAANIPPRPRIEECMVDPDGTIVIVDDGQFRHLMFDTMALTLERMENLFSALGNVKQALAENIGFVTDIACDWAALSDEQFEQLCYDLIYNHPLFNPATIRKLGKSRSRDGGRDIEVLDTPRFPGARPRKWVFQCKLITGSKSLSATKLVDIGDMLDHYDVQGFGVMTSAPIDATLYDKLDAVCGKRGVEQMNFSVLELERALARHEIIRCRYFGK